MSNEDKSNKEDMSHLTNKEIERYSRQLIIPEYSIESQLKLKTKSVLVIGCGGLGCPAALYLSTSGVGRLGLLDNDSIEISNIHRQIAHDLNSIGKSKARNLADKCKSLNDLISYDVYECLFETSVAIDIINKYDVVLDCTDNVITRYLINDACVLLNKPLVSGSALKFEGQLTVYNYLNGPCYRCLYPKAPSPETVSNCSDVGILGPVVGMIGSLQALEAIKILAGIGTSLSARMLLFDGLDFQTRIIKLRPRQTDSCVMCKNVITSMNQSSNENNEPHAELTIENKAEILNSFDYATFCGSGGSGGVLNYNDKTLEVKLLNNETQRISCLKYKKIVTDEPSNRKDHLLIDVRPKCQFKICSLPNSLNIPIDDFYSKLNSTIDLIKNELRALHNGKQQQQEQNGKSIYVVCRRGNDSQIAVTILCQHLLNYEPESTISNNNNENENIKIDAIKDIIGGLQAWSSSVDKNFPKY